MDDLPHGIRNRRPAGSSLFSLGGLLARWCHTDTVWLPWAIAAGALIVLGCWDPLIRGAQADFILIGLAGYEMVVGLTEEDPRASA